MDGYQIFLCEENDVVKGKMPPSFHDQMWRSRKRIHLVWFISNCLNERLVSSFPNFDSRCLTVAYFGLKILYSRCLFLNHKVVVAYFLK